MTTTHPDPQALPRAGEAPAHAERIARLRGKDVYQRRASVREIEADLSALRGLQAASAPLRSLTLTVAVAAGIATPILALVTAAATQSGPAFLAAALFGVCLVIAVVVVRSRVSELRRDKIDAASSLLRRLDVPPGAEVSMQLILRPGDGVQLTNDKVRSDYWAGSHAFSETWEDAWLSLEAPLSGGLAVRVLRSALTAKAISVQSRGTNGSVTRTSTTWTFRDSVAVRYDPAQIPGLASAQGAASAIRLAPEARLAAFENHPGALDVTVIQPQRANNANDIAEIVLLVAQVVHLASPMRALVLTDREAFGTDEAAEREAQVKGGVAAIAAFRRAGMYTGAGLLMLAGLAALYVAQKNFKHAGWSADSAERARASIASAKSAIAKAKTRTKREDAERMLHDAQRSLTQATEDESSEVRGGFVAGALGLLLIGGPVTGIVVSRRRRAKASSNHASN